MSAPDPRLQCVRCSGIVDVHGVSGNGTAYCDCVCRWPNGGCHARIYFLVNPNEKVQPFTLSTGRPHHPECPPFLQMQKERRAAAHRKDLVPEPRPPRLEDFA